MSAKTEDLMIDGTTYRVTSLSTTPMLQLYDELRLVLGESIAESVQKGGTNEQIATRVLFGALGLMPRGMLVRFGSIFAPTCQLGMVATGSVSMIYVPLDATMYEAHFAARPGHWTRWIIACLKHNYSDFLPGSGSFPDQTSGGAATTT